MVVGPSHLAQLQSSLQAVRAGIGAGQSTTDLYSGFQEVFHQGMSMPTVSPFLREFVWPHFAGNPSHEELRGMVDRLQSLLTPAPIRRKDSIAQNSHSWADRTAIRQGSRRIAYKTLDHRADIIGTFIATSLRDSGDRVATFFSGNRSNVFEISLACRRAGVAFTNFHSYLSADKFVEQVEKGRYRILFLDSESLVNVEPVLPFLEDLGCTVVDIDSKHRAALPYGSLLLNAPRPTAQTPDNKPPSYPGPIMYSSGTTGNPKLVSVKATSKVGAAANKLFGIREGDKNLVVGQLYHGGAYSWAKGHLNRGAEVILMGDSSLVLKPDQVLGEIAKKKITNFWISPPWLQGLCDFAETVPKSFDLSSLRAIYVGASHFHPALKRQAEKTFGRIVWENYATTEVGLISILKPEELLAHPATVGRPAPGVEVQIREVKNPEDPKDEGLPVPTGQAGTVFVKNELTGGQYQRGDDFGKLDEDGFLTILGRTVERIVYGGMAVYPREIENELMEMPGIHECHVIGISSDTEDPLIVAAVVPKRGARLKERDITDFIDSSASLAPLVKGFPTRAVIVSSLPRKPYKVNQPILRDMVLRHTSEARPFRIDGHLPPHLLPR